MDVRSGPAGEPADEPRALPRQRWRLVLARVAGAPEHSGRELTDAWDEATESTGLPMYRASGQPRARVAWGAPLPSRMAAESELAEIVLTEALPVWQVREAVTGCLPAGWRLVDLYNVWLGAPALAGQVSGAVYRVTLDDGADAEAVRAAASQLIDAREIVRTRPKGGAMVPYDLRPLLAAVSIVDPGPPVVLRIQTRIHPERGSGRPEEVVGALGDRLGRPLVTQSIARERLILPDVQG